MAKMNYRTLVGAFHDVDHARAAVRDLRAAGFSEDKIGVISRNADGSDTSGSETASNAATGAATGAAAGAGVAALWSLGMTFGLIPVIGPIIAAGPIAAAILSAAGGAAAGGVVGALVGTGVSEEDATYYEGELKSGRTLVTVQVDGRADEAWAILQRHGAYSRQTAGTSAASGTTRTTGTETGRTVQLHEEELHARKDSVQTGEVRVRKEVVTEQKTLEVPVEREEVVIERRPASGRASSADIRVGEEVRIPVTEEQVRIEKTPVVKEEVKVGKRKVQDTEKVSGTVRKEELRVEEKGDANVRGTGKPDKTRKKG